jgi:hypothetical protein
LAERPLIETLVPDEVYRTVTRPDLGDVRIFNAEGFPIVHALCASAENSEAIVSRQSLPVFPLREAQRLPNASRIEVQTSTGTQVRIQQNDNASAVASPSVHIIDARQISDDLRSLQFEWNSADGASEVRVRIEASEDLDRWETAVAGSTLLEASEGGQQLRREQINLPQRRYRYLRVERADGGPPLQITSATAERVTAPAEVEPVWFTADPMKGNEPDALLFDAARVAPVRYARLRMSQENSSIRVATQSRADEKAGWRDRWAGENYLVVTQSERRVSPPGRFDVTSDRYWRVQLPPDSQLVEPPALELGYRPVKLRFLKQGSGPFTLAFGSRRATPVSAANCDMMLADVSAEDRNELISEANLGSSITLGGEAAFKPLPKQTPVRTMVFWGVLIVGVGLLVAMSLSLLKRLKP